MTGLSPVFKEDNLPLIYWRTSPVARASRIKPHSASGQVSYDLLDNVQKQKMLTVTTPPDNVRLERELSDILLECSEPNWNGYDAKPINRLSIENACKFLEALPSNISYPELIPEPTGELGMEWQKRGYHIAISISEDGRISWGGTSPRGRIFGDSKMLDSIPEDILDLLNLIEGVR